MPELPEVQTTVNGLRGVIIGKKITDIWSDFHINTAHANRKNIKNQKYFDDFKKRAIGAKIISVERQGKHIIIDLSNKNSIIVHMKMTGHLMVGLYKKDNSFWKPVEEGPLTDPYNKFLHLVISLSNRKSLVLSDMRKFASVCITKTDEVENHPGIFELGPDSLKISSFKEFMGRLSMRPKWPMKSVLMDQSVVAGIGNIYSDEILWASSVHPLSLPSKTPQKNLKLVFANIKKILTKSIRLGGDSMSDYRNALGEKGGFQNFHKAYRMAGKRCTKPNCKGIIRRIVIKGRSAHFCTIHQIRFTHDIK